ncbi:MAG: hypothetical protein M9949_05785 [Candidatus Kapabacteria bacterium]|nr:hypothetical protein [Candidatus Kapabacteria bacterium]
MKHLIRTLFIALLFFATSNVFGQTTNVNGPIDSTKTYRVELVDGSTIVGKIIQRDLTTIVMKTSSLPEIEIPISKIISIDIFDKSNFRIDSDWFANPHPTGYLSGSSAFNLKKGEGYYQNTYLFLNSFDVGITDFLSLSAGFEFLSLFSNFEPIFFISPKVGFKVAEKFHAGVKILYINILGTGSRNSNGVTFINAMGTYGTLDHNVTGGVAWGHARGVFQDETFINLSGITRISKKASLISENWFVPSQDFFVVSYGVRFFGENLAVDLALFNNDDIAEGIFIGLPYVSVVVKL